jgi:hypothetical protein
MLLAPGPPSRARLPGLRPASSPNVRTKSRIAATLGRKSASTSRSAKSASTSAALSGFARRSTRFESSAARHRSAGSSGNARHRGDPLPPESLASWRAARSTSANCSGSVASRSTAIGPVGAQVAADLLDIREPRKMGGHPLADMKGAGELLDVLGDLQHRIVSLPDGRLDAQILGDDYYRRGGAATADIDASQTSSPSSIEASPAPPLTPRSRCA